MPRAGRRVKQKLASPPTPDAGAGPSTSDVAPWVPVAPTTTGLLALPVELFEMVLSDFEDISVGSIMQNPTTLPKEEGERMRVLRALSQTCKALRASCLPRVWERLEACIEHNETAWYKQVSSRLERRCNGLADNPDLAKFVKIATVTLTRCSTSTVLNAFTKCLALLPNLHTLQIVHTHSQMTTTLKHHFEGKSFPQIRTIILPSCAHNVLRACPGVTSVTCNEDDGSKLVSAIRAVCKGVVHVSGIRSEESIMKRLARAAPNLREIHANACQVRVGYYRTLIVDPGDIKYLSVFKKLQRIVMIVGEEGDDEQIAGTCKLHVTAAQEALKESSAKDKEVVIHYSKCDSPQNVNWRRWSTVRTVHIKV